LPRCPHCDWEIRESDRFCANDGLPLVVAHFPTTHIHQFVAEGNQYQTAIAVENRGANPLSLTFTPTGDSVLLDESELIVPPHRKCEIGLIVNLATSPVVKESIHIRSNESRQSASWISVMVARPPQLALRVEPAGLELADTVHCHLQVEHTGGGVTPIRMIRVDEPWAEVSLEPGTPLQQGGVVAVPLRMDLKDVQPGEGEQTLHVTVELEGVESFSCTVPVTFKSPSRVSASPIVRNKVMPNRRLSLVTTVHNHDEQPLYITKIAVPGDEWIRVLENRLPILVHPGNPYEIAVEVSTHGFEGQRLETTLGFYRNMELVCEAQVRITVLQAEDYDGFVGIDFGTTNSCICVGEQTPQLVTLYRTTIGREIQVIPTAIHFPNPENLDEFVVGKEAYDKAVLPGGTEHSVLRVKRILGRDRPCVVHGQPLDPALVTAKILRHLLDRAEDTVERRIKRAVVAVPADCTSRQMEAMLRSCQLAGLEDTRLEAPLPRAGDTRTEAEKVLDDMADGMLDVLDEPLAAALDVRYSGQVTEGAFLVYDFGGGTLDVSLVRLSGNAGAMDLEVLAVEGMELGGEDLTDMLADYLWQRCWQDSGLSPEAVPYHFDEDEFAFLSQNQKAQVGNNRSILRSTANDIKINLSDLDQYERAFTLFIGHQSQPRRFQVTVTRDEFEALIQPRLEETLTLVEEALMTSGLPAEELGQIILTGQSSQIPLVARLLQRFGVPVRNSQSLKECVAQGAYWLSQHRYGPAAGELRTTGLQNRTSSEYGLMIAELGKGVVFKPVIPKGIPLPEDNQPVLYRYPDPHDPHGLPLKATRPQFVISVARRRSVLQGAGSVPQAIGKLSAIVPEASMRRPVQLHVEMMLNRYKVLSVRVLAGDQVLESEISDV
jgi:molecular chaperone DnaK (HSP70)